jgi:hypothetical protein
LGFVRRSARVGLLCLSALAYCQPALAASFSQAQVSISHPFPNPSTSASTLGSEVVSVSDSGVTLSAQSGLATSSVGLQVELPAGGYDNSLKASAEWADNWTGATSLTPTVAVGAGIVLDGSIDTDFYNAWVNGTTWSSSFSLLFSYQVGDDTFGVSMNADDTPAFIGAFFDRTNITGNLVFTPDATDPTKTHFSMSYASPTFSVDSAGFFEDLSLTYQGDGRGPALDALHTFRAQLGSPDPTVSFTSDSGRPFGITAPEPPAAQLEAIALAGIALAAACRSMLRDRA